MAQSTSRTGILVGVDGSAESDAAIRWATTEAVMRRAPLTLVHALEPMVTAWPIGPVQASITEWQDNAGQVLDQAVKTVQSCAAQSELPDVHTGVLRSVVVGALVEASGDKQMVVVGSHGAGALGRVLLGSVSAGLLHHARCPVAVIRADQQLCPDAPILLGIDGKALADAADALGYAASLSARSRRAPPTSPTQYPADYRFSSKAAAGLSGAVHQPELGEKADLVVVGVVGGDLAVAYP